MKKTIHFVFDFLSPYAYLAATQIDRIAKEHNCHVAHVPVLFAALLNHHGQLGPAEIPSKRAYVMKNCVRLAAELGVPLQPPRTHPYNPLLALRVATVEMPQADTSKLLHSLWQAAWVTGGGLDGPEVVRDAIVDAGLDADVILQQAGESDPKKKLISNGQWAIDAGVFGVPTFLADQELFWGVDSLSHLENYLRGEDCVTQDQVRAWANIEPSSVRKRPSS